MDRRGVSEMILRRVLPALTAVGLFGGALALAAVKETYKDEAGRVIYTVDEDGTVAMFENSNTDITLSITRGTREDMQPRITDVSPPAVHAGSVTSLKLKGKNLVGATVQLSAPAIEVKPYATKPLVLDVPITVPANVPPGEVTIKVTTPIGSTQAKLTILEVQIASSTASRRESEKRQTVSTAAPAVCPAGMVGVAAESGGFCIEIDRSFSGDIRKAEKACALAGKRLCQANEWKHACEQSQADGRALKNMIGEWEWTGSYAKYDVQVQTENQDLSDSLQSVLLGKADCLTTRLYPSWRAGPFPGRCCK